MEPMKIIEKYYKPGSKTYHFLVTHGEMVAKKSLEIAENVKHLKPDLKFIKEAAMLHDIGIFLVNSPRIECFGKKPYVCHGYLGRELLEKEGFPRHALVCERHVGVGISVEDIEKNKMPLPKRDMRPVSLEEKIICFADKFYSKNELNLTTEKSIQQIRKWVENIGKDKIKIFESWLKEFRYKE